MTKTPTPYQEFLSVAIAAARGAGTLLQEHWESQYAIREKTSYSDLQTDVDKASEKFIIELLSARFHHHGIIAEESTPNTAQDFEYVWIVDPLDGTTNYTHRFPMVCVSIALLYNGTPIVAVVYNPISEELFYATKDGGAFLNERPIKTSTVNDLRQSLLATGFAYDRRDNPNNNYAQFFHLTHLSQGVRRMGSAALDLAFLAAGRLDGYWERGLSSWDVAAGILLVTEAGGIVSSYNLVPVDIFSGEILATNGAIHEDLSQALFTSNTKIIIT